MRTPGTKLSVNSGIAWICVLALGVPALAGAAPGQPAGSAAARAQPKRDRLLEEGIRKLAERSKLDRSLEWPSRAGVGTSRVIIELQDGATAAEAIRGLSARLGRQLHTFRGHVAQIPNKWLQALAASPLVKNVYLDRPIGGEMNRVGATTGARTVRQVMGFDGAGIGVAIIDSGITSWHDDLAGSGLNGENVVRLVDFVGGLTSPYDDNGHGTHVAGIVAGNGYDSNGAGVGMAPGAHLVGLKVLDANGAGHISDVIAALDWVVANRADYNIRVVNLSVGAPITESYWTDPLALAAKAAVDAGVVVVAAAGNRGKDATGQVRYGGITSPGNAPWVLTVGAASHMGTIGRWDDTVAGYSSRGPTYIDYGAKPDLVAPGTGIVSLSDPNSALYASKAGFLLGSALQTSYLPYLSLSGTSMAAPVVAGTVALMLQANPSLTPNAVKAILEYTAQTMPGYNPLTEGAGLLNAYGAVDLARFYATAVTGESFPTSAFWSRTITWGNHRIGHGVILPSANGWQAGVVWGAERDQLGDNIVWGNACPAADANCENIVWGNAGDPTIDNIVWGNSVDPATGNVVWSSSASIANDNVVWGNDCGGADCENVVWGASVASSDGQNIVWGNCEALDNIVWGQNGQIDNIVWGQSGAADENIVWGQAADVENIVWGQSGPPDNIVWGNSGPPAVIFGPLSSVPATMDLAAFERLFVPPPTIISTSQSASSTTEALVDGSVAVTSVDVTTTIWSDGSVTTTTTTTVTTTAPDGTVTTSTSTATTSGTVG